jgi:uncharacterized protein YegL
MSNNFKQFSATANTPQIVGFVLDDSGSMSGSKAEQMTNAMQDLIIHLQSRNLGTTRYRFLMVIVTFGSKAQTIVAGQAPNEISIEEVVFRGQSGGTNMADALSVAADAITQAIDRCRGLEGFQESIAPPPLVLFFSDGANTGAPVDTAANRLKAVTFGSGSLQIVSVGIGMRPNDFPVMQRIASSPDLAVNLNPDQLTEFIADAAQTLVETNTNVAEAVKENAFTVRAE